MIMEVTDDEIEMIETLRGLDGHEYVALTMIREDGVWEAVMRITPHHRWHHYAEWAKTSREPSVIRGVGTSFEEAFNRLAGNDDEGSEEER